jgi:hypothetical protein
VLAMVSLSDERRDLSVYAVRSNFRFNRHRPQMEAILSKKAKKVGRLNEPEHNTERSRCFEWRKRLDVTIFAQ